MAKTCWALWLAGVVAGVMAAAGPAAAAAPLKAVLAPSPKPTAPPPDDGLGGGGFYLEADAVTENGQQLITAKGAVTARYKGHVLHADELDYARDTGSITARGHVVIINPDGTSQFARYVTLSKDMSAGLAVAFATRLQNNVKIAASRVERQNSNLTEMDKVIFTPCEVCAENGEKSPTWSIRARKVVQNKARKALYFRDAVIQIKGVGVFWLPVFYAADPSAARKSGFLLPVASYSQSRGLSYEQPYYLVVSPSSDLTISPQFNTKVNPFLNVEFRKRFYSGFIDVRGGFTDDADFTSGGAKFGPHTLRSYILANGQFDLGSHWSWGFTAEQTSDRLLFEKYSIPDVFMDRGLYAADGGRLISQINLIRQDQRSYLSIAAVDVQGLRPGDIQSTIPTIAPLIEAHYEPAREVLGGRLRIDGSAVILTRNESPTLSETPGVDSRRATAGLDWRSTLTLSDGLRIAPFAQGRVDVFDLSNLAPPDAPNATVTRAFGDVGADISYPLIRQTPSATWILEPMAQIAVGPNVQLDPRIPNEDSQVWQFDETNLFDVNRSPGYDLYEGGQSLTLAGRATLMLPDGRFGSLILGRVFHTRTDFNIPARTGLQTPLSDWVVGASAQLSSRISLFSRWRLNSSSLAVDYTETGVDFTGGRIDGYISYLKERISPSGLPVNSLDFRGEIWATKHWGLDVYSIVDSGTWRQNDIGLVYKDDCLRVEVLYRRNETYNGTFGPTSSVVLRLSLATFGNTR